MADESRKARAATLFDIRRIIGSLLGFYGLLLIVLGATDSAAEIDKAQGVNINLWAGVGMLVVGALFWAWALWRPLGEELSESGDDEPGDREDR
jgi:drug/metabolite transporter (DMT)-like permease